MDRFYETVRRKGGDMKALGAVIALALIEFSILGVMTGRARVRLGVPAPATTGNPEFERYFRVHQNTMESLVVFIPAVYLFGLIWNMHLAAAIGLLFIVARVVYAN